MRNQGVFFSKRRFVYQILPFLTLWMSLLAPRSALAQIPGLGMGWLLNPEGSRLFPQAVIYPRHPGKPDLRWKAFDWNFREMHVGPATYRLFFYDVSEHPSDPLPYWTAEYAAPIIELQIRELARDFRFWPKDRFSYLLFSSYREFQQANVFFIEEGVQGVTSTQEPTMAIPYWGERETFRHISHHELVHQFQVQKIGEYSKELGDSPEYLIPLWFIEGMAEYYSLRGVDAEARTMLRDLWFHADDEESQSKLLDFFDPGPLDFQHVYKLGQLKNAFLEERFGKGTIQRVLEEASQHLGTKKSPTFSSVVTSITEKKADEVSKQWADYFKTKIVQGFDKASDLGLFQSIPGITDTIDHYAISPRGKWLLTREVDPLTGGVSIQMGSMEGPYRKNEIIHDRQDSAVSLYFFQVPSLAISDNQLAFMALTARGPELELRSILPDGSTTNQSRVQLHQKGLT
ncbi:MAG: hypothetical protein KGQ59_12690, partial [Bdellovibrionales bacterium]|nr:hypothetical protein [Bdellovibrionales bacterium]